MTAELLLGPMLRYVNSNSATIWVECDRPCAVTVTATGEDGREFRATAETWSVHHHHYALVILTGLPERAALPYQVHLDETRVWPHEDFSTFPASLIRTFTNQEDFRLSFGSCRRSAGESPDELKSFGADALVALARAMHDLPIEEWPDALFCGGDQVYADMPSPEQKQRLLAAHGVSSKSELDPDDPMTEVADEIQSFEEYTWLYYDSWGRTDVRWLFSTVPTMMLLDDHDLRDDWNTSHDWRKEMSAKPWWRARVVGAFASYWVYQHLGNLSPTELAGDQMLALMHELVDDTERTSALDDFAWRADCGPSRAQWSFVRDFGADSNRIRLVAIDSRASRVLEPRHRAMLDDEELDWLAESLADPVEHLMIGATLPMLMVPGLHHLEGWTEALAAGRYGARVARWSEQVRQKVDLEHWAAFRRTFSTVMELLDEVTARDDAPASISILSGDVHCSYVAEGRLPRMDVSRTGFHQLTMSPFRNPLELPIRWANRLLSRRAIRNLLRRMADHARVERVPVDWEITEGLWFDNGVMTVVIHGREARVLVEHAHVSDGRQVLQRTATVELTPKA